MTIIETDNFPIVPPPRFNLDSSPETSESTRPISSAEIGQRRNIACFGHRVIEVYRPAIDVPDSPVLRQPESGFSQELLSNFRDAKNARNILRDQLPSDSGYKIPSFDKSLQPIRPDADSISDVHDGFAINNKSETRKHHRLRKIVAIGAAAFSIVAGSSMFGGKKISTDTIKTPASVVWTANQSDQAAPVTESAPLTSQAAARPTVPTQKPSPQLDISAETPWQAAAEAVGESNALQFLINLVDSSDGKLILHGTVDDSRWISVGESGPSDTASVVGFINQELSW